MEEDSKQGLVVKSSRNIYTITSIIDRTAASNMVEAVSNFFFSQLGYMCNYLVYHLVIDTINMFL